VRDDHDHDDDNHTDDHDDDNHTDDDDHHDDADADPAGPRGSRQL